MPSNIQRALGYYLAAGIGAAADFGAFAVMVAMDTRVAVSATLSGLFGLIISFFLNAQYVFLKRPSVRIFLRFGSVGVAASLCAFITVPLLTEVMGNPQIAKIIWMLFQSLLQYVAHSVWTFKNTPR